MSEEQGSSQRRLQTLLQAAVLVGLVLVYVLIKWSKIQGAWVELLVSVIPSLVAAIVAALAVYYALVARGTPTYVHEFATELKEVRDSMETMRSNPEGVIDFYPNFRQIPWSNLITTSRSIDIVVCYFDSWVKSNWESLSKFFDGGGHLRVILPDPDDENGVPTLLQRFPEYPVDTLRLKVANTAVKLDEILKESRSRSASLESYLYPGSLNYNAIRFDGRQLLLSVYEQFRHEKIDSSAILLDLERSDHLKNFWDKEIGEFVRQSTRQDMNELRSKVSKLRAPGRE